MHVSAPTGTRVSNAPRGCNAPVIGLALRPEERETLSDLAASESRSKASMARLLVLEALNARRGHSSPESARSSSRSV